MPVSPKRSDVHAYIEAHKAEHVARMREFMMQPAVSRDNLGVRECAVLLASYFRELGCQEVEIAETPYLPSVWAYYDAGAARTLAVYGYFDTNIVGSGWNCDPFAG